MLLQLQDFGTSLWQLHCHATSSPAHLKGRVMAAIGPSRKPRPMAAAAGYSDVLCQAPRARLQLSPRSPA
jgi:hypothetical protein